MYRPQYSINENQQLALQLVEEYPLGLLITRSGEAIDTGYLPFFTKEENQEIYLHSHLAKANPQWRKIDGDVVVIFQGPHRYISPTIYVNKMNVPTWSYAVVEIHGTLEIISSSIGIKDILNETVKLFENKNGTSWSYDIPEKMQEKLESAIVGIKIKIKKIEAKFKLSQNRSAEDYHSVLEFFKNSKNQRDLELYNWMLKTNELK